MVQPGVAAAYPDQLLVQPVDAPAVWGELPWGVGEDGADGVVTTHPVLLDSAEPLLVAGVDRRRAPDGEQDGQRVGEVPLVIELAGLDIPCHGRVGCARALKIRVRGILSETLLGAFPGLHAQARGSQTVLVGPLPDQAALHGVLAWIEALGLELLEVRRLGS